MQEFTPDHAEEDLGDFMDNVVPTRGYQMLPVVGIGGSAGGLEALQGFFSNTSAKPGVAFVVVMHLSSSHESVLAEVLQRCTPMPVLQVQDTIKVEPDTVYVIPPGKTIQTWDGYLQLGALPQERHRHVTVDIFFRTLADTHGPHAAAIVLSGADGDGAIGIKRIKERGGLTIAQDPEEAQVSSMPLAAIATGMVDWTLPVAQMSARVVQYLGMEHAVRLPPESVPGSTEQRAVAESDESALRDVLAFLRSRTGRDFASYKRATVVRRIGRRMQVNNIADLAGYLDCLRTRPGEAGALLQDLLISVTNFFRDAECFAALQAQIPRLFEGRSGADTLRVWVAGCATGEEAYSIAMLLTEHARTLDMPPALQVFASDLDDNAIRVAREGVYPAAITADVSEERLRRFFVKDPRGYRVRRELRECVLFAVHDVLRDSPFSRVDLLSCRNLLIYLNRDAQARVLDIFHFSLLAGGTLFLGSSESIDEASQHFSVIDKKHRIFCQRQTPRIGLPVHGGSNAVTLALNAQSGVLAGPVVTHAAIARPADTRTPLALGGRAVSWAEIHLKLLEHLSPPSILVDSEHEIVHMSPTAGRFLHMAGGEPTRNLLRLVHPALRIELRAALYKAASTGERAVVPPSALEVGGETSMVSIDVYAISEVAAGLTLIIINTLGAASPQLQAVEPAQWPRPGVDQVAEQLVREVERLKSHLRDTVEQYETSTEELKASNEELQAMNEELRSATEELETSREELQSINEELTTVNHELKSKVDELGHANSDMQNLMDATAIATVFLDRQLRITRYTPSAVTLFNFIATDVGRPLAHLHTQLRYPQLVEDANLVLERLSPVERQIGTPPGQSYLVRLLPYRTADDRIAGVVLTFVDITERLQHAEALRQSEDRFRAIVNQATVGVVQTELDGRITFANQHFAQLLGYATGELEGRPLLDLVHLEDYAQSAQKFERLGKHREQFQIEKRCLRKDGSAIWLHNSVGYLADAQGSPVSAILVCTDITERRRTEAALRESTEWLRLMMENAVEYGIFSTDLDRRITTWNSGAERLLGYTEQEAVGQSGDIIFTQEDCAAGAPQQEARTALEHGGASDDRIHQRKDGSRFWASGATMPMRDAAGNAVGLLKILRDQSEQRASQQALERSRSELLYALQQNENARAELQAADEAKDRFLAVLSHELRNPLASISSASMALGTGKLHGDDQAHAAEIVQRQSQIMKVLLDDLLDVSRLRLGKLTLHPIRVTLQEIVDSALESTRGLIHAARHHLEVSLPGEPVLLHADPVRMAQVVSNLLINATKYTPDGGRITLKGSVAGNQLSLSVEDSGIGMDPARVEAMFEMFAQDTGTGGRGQSGLGIGLALVRNIVDLHHGRVRGESEGLGGGSRFTVELPLAPDAEVVVNTAAAGPQSVLTGTVLVVDDNADIRWSVTQLLKGFDVISVGSGAEALAVLQERRVDVGLLDLGLPDMNGMELARAIRALPWGSEVLLVAVTGWGQDHDRSRARQAGFDAHLVKPLDMGELVALIARRPRNEP
jgi:two-component system, chemotaxis family, CheB/CheR fusion protein